MLINKNKELIYVTFVLWTIFYFLNKNTYEEQRIEVTY
jgi:hypothetical protein